MYSSLKALEVISRDDSLLEVDSQLQQQSVVWKAMFDRQRYEEQMQSR